MSIKVAGKFFEENITRHIGAKSDPALYNLNKGLLNLVVELNREIQTLHEEIAHVSKQVGQLAR